jgi:hypothetical protein
VTGVLYVLAYVEVIGTWTFGIAVLVLWQSLPAIGTALRPHKMLSPEALAARQLPGIERVGIDTPYPEGYGEHLDRQLGLPARHRTVAPPAPVPGAAPLDPNAEEDIQHVHV